MNESSSAAVALGVCPTSNVAGSPGQICNGGGSCTALVKWNPGIIYRLTSPSGKAYVGQTRNDLRRRLNSHSKDKRSCRAITSAIKVYGLSSFSIEKMLIGVEAANLNALEQFAIGLSSSLSPFGYNLTAGGDAPVRISEESRFRMSQAAKGKLVTAETRIRMGLSRIGGHRTEETRAKMSRAALGRKVSAEGRANMSLAMKKRALSGINIGRPVSVLTREKLAAANRGRKATPETRKKMSEAQTRRYQNAALRLAGSSCPETI